MDFIFLLPKSLPPKSVKFHAPILSKISVGQDTDIKSHQQKYRKWKLHDEKTQGLILYGVSRGTAATFCAFAKEKYKEVKLVILEGAIDTIPNVLKNRYKAKCPTTIAGYVSSGVNSALTLFTQYRSNGISPLACVKDYPEGIPTVFITSKVDTEVPCENTRNIANALAERGKNDVYLLELKQSSHPNYMFDNSEDRKSYETFIHAIYKKYKLHHDYKLAKEGEKLLEGSLLYDSHRCILMN